MISKSLALKVLNAALATGGDYAEIYAEQVDNNGVMLENGKVDQAGTSQTYGAGIRILKDLRCVYGYTSDLSAKSLIDLANKLSASFEGKRVITVSKIKKAKVKIINPIEKSAMDVPAEEKIAFLRKGYEACKAVDPRLVRIQNGLVTDRKTIEIFNAEGEEGKLFVNFEERSRAVVVSMAFGGPGSIETNFSAPGAYNGWDWFTNKIDYCKVCKESGEKAIMMLGAKECPSGQYTVVINNGWGGVLFHEACGHPLEASSCAKKLSVFADSLGKPIASKIVSAVDDGTMPNEWGSNNIDSEGIKTRRNQLIKNGICVGYMVDKFNGRRMGMEPNGTSRRQSYRFCPTSRMSNTYICAGKDTHDDIIKDTPLGIYVANFGGGSVDPSTGDFNFSASEAYIIRDGKIAEPVKGCTLIGKSSEVLFKIDRVGNDVDLGQGNCGSSSGSVPVNVGQPTIRLSSMTVGGRGGELK